jgi:ribokinase
VVNRRLSRHFPTCSVKPVDATAAGDTFNGALAVGLAEGRSMPQAIDFANAAAALSVTRPGAQASIPTRSQVDRFLGEQRA